MSRQTWAPDTRALFTPVGLKYERVEGVNGDLNTRPEILASCELACSICTFLIAYSRRVAELKPLAGKADTR